MKTTWAELSGWELGKEGVYLLHDAGGNIAYVGHSANVGKRLLTHYNGGSTFGKYLARHAPGSFAWVVEVLEGDRAIESALIKEHEPPFNQQGRNDPKRDRILTPPSDPEWREKLYAEFIEAAVDDYIERVVVPHRLGFLLGTTLHRWRREWFDAFYKDYSPREEWAKVFAFFVAGGDQWAMEAGRKAYDIALAALQSEIEIVREFCKTVPMPEPDAYGRLPMRDRFDAVNARDIARQMGIWPAEFKANEDRSLRMPLDDWKGFPMSMWRPDLGWSQPR